MIFRLARTVLMTAGGAAASLLLFDLLRIPWNAPLLAVAIIVIGVIAFRVVPAHAPASAEKAGWEPALHLFTAALVIAHAIAGIRPRLWDWTDWLITRRDYFFIWGYKARLFFLERGIPWRFLRSLPNDFTHPDYPLLVPLLFDVPAVMTGTFDPRAFALLQTLLGSALLVIAYYCLRDELAPIHAAAGTLVLTGSALLPFYGFAEGPLVAFGASAALLIRRHLRGHDGSTRVAVVLLAMAAMTKNEGIAFFVAVCLASPRIIRRVWPAGVVIAVWLAARAAMGLHTDVFAGRFLARIAHNVAMFPRAFANVPTYQSALVIAALIAIAMAPVENIRRERFLLTVAAIQIGFYLAAYAVSPHDVAGHVNGSWDRISSHVTMLVAFAGITSLRRS